MPLEVNTEKSLETIKILIHSSMLSDKYKLKRIKEILGTLDVKVLKKEK